jgi:hypothetical protein
VPDDLPGQLSGQTGVDQVIVPDDDLPGQVSPQSVIFDQVAVPDDDVPGQVAESDDVPPDESEKADGAGERTETVSRGDDATVDEAPLSELAREGEAPAGPVGQVGHSFYPTAHQARLAYSPCELLWHPIVPPTGA